MRILGAAALGLATATFGAQPGLAKEDPREFYDGLEYRNIGPYRGGRATAAAGVASDPLTYYMGATGGLFKTTNAGVSWFPVSDEDFGTGPVGSIDVAPSDPNVVVVGMGESPFRGVASSQGDGVYISTDAGESWTHAGLKDTRQISSVKIHPTNPDVIWVAAQGDSWSANPNRGVYKTTDGGRTWRRVLAGENDHTGAVDLEYDANNPRILYAAMWDHDREPWEIRSGGPGSGLWKSTDGGETWAELTEDLPKLKGKMGVAPSPAKPGRVWAVIEASEGDGEGGGLYRSEDYGESWTKVNSSREIQARSWYYMHIFADPKDAETVYVMNAPFMKSVDGGKTFVVVDMPHTAQHDLWLNPDDPSIMANANDGGATISLDGGATWSTQHNQPTAQFYRVITDNQIPYRLYAGQQDNSTVAIRSRAPDGRIGRDDYHSIGGGESAHVAFDPDDPRYIYAGSYLGYLTEYDAETNATRFIAAYPETKFGVAPKERKYRSNWNAPVLGSAHDPSVIFHAGNHVMDSRDRGQSWAEYSPDLTRNEEATQGPGGRPITNEVSENYNTFLSLAESPHEKGVLWAGSDDGRVHITR
ncbi:MAG: WD40/YVTN/BNR-like repeat-containing protein, partial [Maricaulaceae bacterium]